MDTRRCNSESCKVAVAKRSAVLDAPLVTILENPVKDWQRLAYGSVRIAKRVIDVDWKKFNQDNYVMAHCFVRDTMILMADGTEKPIQDIRIGDDVITHLGRVRKVTAVMSRAVDEEMVEIEPASLPSMLVTKEHPFAVIREDESWCKHNREWQKCIYGLSKRCSTWGCKTNGAEPQFVFAGELKKGDRTFTPSLRLVRESGFAAEAMRLLGYYVAEGRVDHNSHRREQASVRFSIAREESETIGANICRLMGSCFGVYSHGEFSNPDSGGYTLSFASDRAAEWFLRHAGCGSKIKRLSAEVMYSSPDIQKELLLGWADGDGEFNESKRLLRISTSSPYLASQGEVLIDRIGGLAIVHKMTNSGGPKNRAKKGIIWHVCVKHSNMGMIRDQFSAKNYSRWPRTGQRYRHAACVISEIVSIKSVPYKGLVFNFSVAEDESYVANRCAVHNCSICCSVKSEDNGYYIDPICSELVNNNGNAWTNEVLLATFRSFVGGDVFLEHIQIPELSKGKILDAVIRPVTHKNAIGSADVYWVDILTATHRKHTDLVKRITSGEMTSLSMGCSANNVVCSKCGIVLTDDDKNCEHLDHELLQYFTDKQGIRRIVAELCGKSYIKDGKRVGDPKSVQFIEASWVERPAFTGAVLNHYISEVPKLSSIMGFNHARLAECVEDIFKLRVADVQGMTVLRVARAEWIRRQREATIEKVARSLYWGK